MQEDLDALYRGLSSTLGEKEDHIMVEDLAGQIFYLFSNKCVICSLVTVIIQFAKIGWFFFVSSFLKKIKMKNFVCRSGVWTP